jgi:hypothetical protein
MKLSEYLLKSVIMYDVACRAETLSETRMIFLILATQ